MPPRVALGLSVPLVRRFRERFPRAVITVLEGLSLSLREALVAGRLDWPCCSIRCPRRSWPTSR